MLAAVSAACGSVPYRIGCADRAAGSRRRSGRALPATARRCASATQAADIWAARLAGEPEGLRVGLEAGAGALLAGHQRPAASPSARPRSKPASPPARTAIAHRAAAARRPLLAGRQHGRARRIVRHAAGHQVSRADQGRAADGAEARSGVPARLRRSRARPLVLQGAGPVRRQQQASRKSTCASR